MTDIIERVARVLCFKNGMDPNLSLGGDHENFLWMEYESQSRAAIEVTGVSDLLKAGLKLNKWVERVTLPGGDDYLNGHERTDCKDGWDDLEEIRAALNPTEGEMA